MTTTAKNMIDGQARNSILVALLCIASFGACSSTEKSHSDSAEAGELVHASVAENPLVATVVAEVGAAKESESLRVDHVKLAADGSVRISLGLWSKDRKPRSIVSTGLRGLEEDADSASLGSFREWFSERSLAPNDRQKPFLEYPCSFAPGSGLSRRGEGGELSYLYKIAIVEIPRFDADLEYEVEFERLKLRFVLTRASG